MGFEVQHTKAPMGDVGSTQESSYWARAHSKWLSRRAHSWRVGPDPEKIFLSKVARSLGRRKTLLDIGCGVGTTIKSLAPKVAQAYGIDVSRMLIREASKGAPRNAHFRVADGRKLPFPDQYFDVVMSQRGPATETISFAREMCRVLKLGGLFIAITIGERDKENVKRIFGRGQLFNALIKNKTASARHIALLKRLGFASVHVKEYDPIEYFATLEDLVRRLEYAPIIPHFHRIRDRRLLNEVKRKFRDGKGIRTNSHRLIVTAVRKNLKAENWS